jgi:hypothetical protein
MTEQEYIQNYEQDVQAALAKREEMRLAEEEQAAEEEALRVASEERALFEILAAFGITPPATHKDRVFRMQGVDLTVFPEQSPMFSFARSEGLLVTAPIDLPEGFDYEAPLETVEAMAGDTDWEDADNLREYLVIRGALRVWNRALVYRKYRNDISGSVDKFGGGGYEDRILGLHDAIEFAKEQARKAAENVAKILERLPADARQQVAKKQTRGRKKK